MPDADLRFLLDQLQTCPRKSRLRPCPLLPYRRMDPPARLEALSDLSENEKRRLADHCTQCLLIYG